ncbi:MAG: hypothetical protein JSV04_06235 [Candidatus Heimdallarchaeota archaeon]|nr:MAG: hypothetical protein JSV04_06235 [Candidatus Heimdallarchaeota archaeon]
MLNAPITSELLFFVVGRSGSGKDTVMRKTVDVLSKEHIPVNILQRHITRPPDKTEHSLYISEAEFLQKKENNEFTLFWFVYNNWYGCSRDLLEGPLKRGEIMLVNLSRAILHRARMLYPQSKIILIKVQDRVAEERIIARGRENSKHLAPRVSRMQNEIDLPLPDKIIHNNGDLDSTVHELSSYVRKIYQDTKESD